MNIDEDNPGIKKSAVFSLCGLYRYELCRSWQHESGEDKGSVMFIGLNPSTAGEVADDPTIRRCVAFAKSWGYSGIIVTNLFAYKATNPKMMMAVKEPIGAHNDNFLKAAADGAALVVAAWGARGKHMGRDKAVRAMIPNLHYLWMTKDKQPGHPLFLKGDLKPIKWED